MPLRSNRVPDIIYRRPRPVLVSTAGITPPGMPGEPGPDGFVPEPSWPPMPDPGGPSPMPKPEGDPVPAPRPIPGPIPSQPMVRMVRLVRKQCAARV
jgi:hypothetical protein